MTNHKSEWIHFIGIGGTGMSGIAKVLLELGRKVSGSDLSNSETTKRLTQCGAMVFHGHHGENIKEGINWVVVSSAIPENNPEIIKAKELKIPIIQRAEMLATLMKDQKAICVAGAHGKTTTTSMISLVLEKNGFDPTVVVGGELNDIGGNAKLGKGEYLVAEADESDGSFLKLLPWSTVITNIENDHLDHYGSIENIIKSFEEFIALGSSQGYSILCIDDPQVKKLAEMIPGKLITYGLSADAQYKAEIIEQQGSTIKALITYKNQLLGEIHLKVPGKHNMVNALAAIAVGRGLGIAFSEIKDALLSFSGVQRRFQLLGKVNDIEVVDDYAHHPTEIKATLAAARSGYQGRIIALFQPHRFSRTHYLAKEFGLSFQDADKVIITEVYGAGEKPIPGVTTQLILDEIPEEKDVLYIKDDSEIVKHLVSIVEPGDLVLTLGAGNVCSFGFELVEELKKK